MESLTFLPARTISGVLQGIEEFCFMFTLESVRQGFQDYVHSLSVATSSGSSPSQASQAGPVSLLKTRGPGNFGWSAREEKPQLHLLPITLELARLGTCCAHLNACVSMADGSWYPAPVGKCSLQDAWGCVASRKRRFKSSFAWRETEAHCGAKPISRTRLKDRGFR